MSIGAESAGGPVLAENRAPSEPMSVIAAEDAREGPQRPLYLRLGPQVEAVPRRMTTPRTLHDLLTQAEQRIERHAPADAYEAMTTGALLIDVRSADDRARDGVVPGSLHIPRTVLEDASRRVGRGATRISATSGSG